MSKYGPHNPVPTATRKKIAEDYISGMSCRKIADKYSLSGASVYFILRKDIPECIRAPSEKIKLTPELHATLAQLLREGETVVTISKTIGHAPETTRRLMDEADLIPNNKYSLVPDKYLPYLEAEAKKRGVNPRKLFRQLISTIMEDKMIDAIIDD